MMVNAKLEIVDMNRSFASYMGDDTLEIYDVMPGMGNRAMPFGWEEGVKDFIAQQIRSRSDISAKELSQRIVLRSEQNDVMALKDDTSCCVIYMRKPRNCSSARALRMMKRTIGC